MSKQQGVAIPAPSMQAPLGPLRVVPAGEWNTARRALLAQEKALMEEKDRLAAERRRLPVTAVDTGYRFVGPNGEVDLLGLFQGRRQLIVYRFFYAPDVVNWPDGACTGCSLFADQIAHPAHLAARDTTLAFVTAASQERIAALKRRMGWADIPFYSLPDERFSRDFDVAEMFGLNVFVREGERVFRSYFMTGRGAEEIGPVWSFLDLTPLGRQENWQDSPEGRPQGDPYEWWRLHDADGAVAESNPPRSS